MEIVPFRNLNKRQKYREAGWQRGKKGQKGRKAERQRGREAARQRGREAARQRGREAARQRDINTYNEDFVWSCYILTINGYVASNIITIYSLKSHY